LALLARVTDLDVGGLRDAFENVCTKQTRRKRSWYLQDPNRTGPNYISGGKIETNACASAMRCAIVEAAGSVD
jgi:hypothetical protein